MNRQPEVPICHPFKITYAIARDEKTITFQPCGFTSHHPMDIRQKYCARCHRFMDLIELAKEVTGEPAVR